MQLSPSAIERRPQWTWPQGRASVLYEWSWFDTEAGEVVGGWSRSDQVDERGYIHLEAEALREARTVQVDQDGRPSVEPHTFTALTPLPLALRNDTGAPLPWVRAALGAE